jgi:hypothetical protein
MDSSRSGRGGRRSNMAVTLPGRGHSALPVRSSMGQKDAILAPATPMTTDLAPRSSLTTTQQFEQILALCQTSITETRGVREELSQERDAQARINTDLRNSLARAHAAIDALTNNMRK